MPRRTKLLASTALEICFWPRRLKYSATWPVLGPMVTLRRTWAVKRPQRVGASMVMGEECGGEMCGRTADFSTTAAKCAAFGRNDDSVTAARCVASGRNDDSVTAAR